jgi:DNA-binding GntR family transcriptional regulator
MGSPIQQAEESGLGDPIYVRICQRIRRDILAGILEPGARLRIEDLKNRYHVSQMPIREALQQLQGEWLVTISPNRGARVRQVDEAFIGHMYEIRGQIEALLTRRCAESATEEDIQGLLALEAECEVAAAGSDFSATLDANRRLHRAIYQVGGNPLAMELLERHFGLLQAIRKIYGFGPERFHCLAAEHRQLVDAIRRRDGKLSEELARQHCESARKDLIARMQTVRGKG